MIKVKFRRPILLLFCTALIFMLLLTLRPSISYACSCAILDTPIEEVVENSAAVFTGKVIDIKKPTGPIVSSLDPIQVTFEIRSSWKGINENKVTLTTARSTASCGFDFTKGESYLVYASDGGKPGELNVHNCSRTVQLASAQADLRDLGQKFIQVRTQHY